MKEEEIVEKLEAIANFCTDLIDQIQGGSDPRVKKARQQAKRRAEKDLCTYCGDPVKPGEEAHRGAHGRCYKRIKREIAAGEITDNQAVNRGYYLPGSRGGRPPIKASF